MSHFIGLVFVDTETNNIDNILAPFNEQDDNYSEFIDCTEEVEDEFANLPEKDERLREDGTPYPYPKDKEHYPTIEALAKDWFGYVKEGDEWGYLSNPNAKWDWWSEGNRWSGYIFGKDGGGHDCLEFDEVDWEKMFTSVKKTYENYKGEVVEYDDNHIPFCYVDMDGHWAEKGEMGWWAIVSNEKEPETWEKEVKGFVKHVQEMPVYVRKNILVYAIDFHI